MRSRIQGQDGRTGRWHPADRLPKIMVLSAFGREGYVIGGPYEDRHPKFKDAIGIKLAPEVVADAHVSLKIPDFGVPSDTTEYQRAAEDAVVMIMRGHKVYVGCLMGKGRTGTFLAVMAKIAGVPMPLEYVRANYHPGAVETAAQKKFIENMPSFLPRLRTRLRLLFSPIAITGS